MKIIFVLAILFSFGAKAQQETPVLADSTGILRPLDEIVTTACLTEGCKVKTVLVECDGIYKVYATQDERLFIVKRNRKGEFERVYLCIR